MACERSDLPIEPGAMLPTLAPPSATPISTASPTARPTLTATPGPGTPTAEPTATPNFDTIPIPNGGFDTNLDNWSASDPRWVTWQDGYARLNINGSSQAASVAQGAQVPLGDPVTLHFRYRSEEVEAGPCSLESRFGEILSFPADQQWRDAMLDYTGNAGQALNIGVSAGINDQCHWVDVDDFYWMVPIGSPTAEPVATSPVAITPGASFTSAFSVTVEGDIPFGNPADLADGQTVTWASLRAGTGAWVLKLDTIAIVAGVRLTAHRDGPQGLAAVRHRPEQRRRDLDDGVHASGRVRRHGRLHGAGAECAGGYRLYAQPSRVRAAARRRGLRAGRS